MIQKYLCKAIYNYGSIELYMLSIKSVNMIVSYLTSRSMIVVFFMSTFVNLSAQEELNDTEFEPRSGQPGKDVIWVPTPQVVVEKMLDMAKVTPDDFVIDLGSGDGRTVITAAKRGAQAMGVEYNPSMVELSKRNAIQAGVGDRAEFIQGDLFEADLSKATVITMFLLPSINMKLRPNLLELKPGTRIVSNSFSMRDWIPDETARNIEGCESFCDALLWIVPAKVDGTWETQQGELVLKQEFQMVSGTLNTDSITLKIHDGRLYGDEIRFTVNKVKYIGHVNSKTIEGTFYTDQSSNKWTAKLIVN
jgi:precorrin-6B methylase 2